MIMIYSSKKFMNSSLLKWRPSSLGECCFFVSFATVSKICWIVFILNQVGKVVWLSSSEGSSILHSTAFPS
jgi:hypothetical protein